MNIEISGKGFTVGESFRGRIESELQKKVTKYFKNAISANVTVTGKHDGIKTITISINEGTGRDMEIRARAENRDLEASFNEAVDKIEKQLRRYHKRLNNHQRSIGEQVKLENTDLIQIKKYVLSADNDDEHDENEGEISPVIIAEKYSKLESLSVKDAVMKMNLSSLPALMFINKSNDRLNIVYNREDGHVSWIDPSEYYEQKLKKNQLDSLSKMDNNNREDIPSKGEVDNGRYFLEARDWHYERYISIYSSRTKAFLLMVVSSIAVVIVISNIIKIFPLVSLYPVHISHRVTDGSVVPRLYIADSHKNPDVSILNVLVAQYIRSREIFDSITTIDSNIKIISNISSPEVKKSYEDFLYKSKDSPLFALQQNDKREMEILSIDFVNDNDRGQMDNYEKVAKKPSSSLGINLIPNRAKILLKTFIVNKGTNNIREETLWIVDMEFDFFGIQQVQSDNKDSDTGFKLENFEVTKYNLTKQ